MKHHCHCPGCTVEVPTKMFMCRRHWYALPKNLRDRIWATYVAGQEVRKDPSVEYLDAAQACFDWLRDHGHVELFSE